MVTSLLLIFGPSKSSSLLSFSSSLTSSSTSSWIKGNNETPILLSIFVIHRLYKYSRYFWPQWNFYPLWAPSGPPEGPWRPLRAPEASITCLPYSPLNVDMIWYAFLHTLDLNGIFTPWGPPEGPLRPPEGPNQFFFAETWFLSHFILLWIKKKHIQSHLK